MIEQAQHVHVAPAIRRYIVDLVEATRRHSDMYLGREPARLDHDPAGRARHGRRRRARLRDPRRREGPRGPVLAHRVIVTADAVMSGRSPEVILQEILADVAVPVAEKH